jgi:adenosine deaminase
MYLLTVTKNNERATTPPTAELHVHLEGTLEPNTILQIAAANGLPAPAESEQELLDRYAFTDLQSFLREPRGAQDRRRFLYDD